MDLKLLKQLDYTIYSNSDRTTHVQELISEYECENGTIDLNAPAVATQLEGMANFILYGKDPDTGKSCVDNKEVRIPTKYSSFKKKEPESLEALQESPTFSEAELRPYNFKNVYTKPKNTISRNRDGDIPGMQQLWEAIDTLQAVYDASNGSAALSNNSLPEDEDIVENYASAAVSTTFLLSTSLSTQDVSTSTEELNNWSPAQSSSDPKPVTGLSLYKLRHWLIDLKKHQYLLRDSHYIQQNIFSAHANDYHPTYIDWDSPKHCIDLTDPEHIYHLLEWYSKVVSAVWEDVNNPTKYLYWYLEDIIEETRLAPPRMLILAMKVDGEHNYRICEELQRRFGLHYSENYISTIWKKEICGKIAEMAQLVNDRFAARDDLSKWKRCNTCGYLKLRDEREFVKKNTNKDGLSNRCKACDKDIRDAKKRAMED